MTNHVHESSQQQDEQPVHATPMGYGSPMNGNGAAAGAATISRRGFASVAIATGVAALSVLIMQFITARTLSEESNSVFQTFWALLSFVTGTMNGLGQEVTRAVSSVTATRPTSNVPGIHRVRTTPASLWIGAVVAVLIVVSSPLWVDRAFGTASGDSTEIAPAIVIALPAIAAVLCAGQAAISGSLSGRRHWLPFSGIVVTESLGRTALMAAAAAIGLGFVGLQFGAVIPSGLWIILLIAFPVYRRAASARGDVGSRTFTANSIQAMLAAAASAALIVSFPFLAEVTRHSDTERLSAAFKIALGLTRAPLLIPLAAFSTVIVTYFVMNRTSGTRAVLKYVPIVIGVGLVIAALFAWAGPWIVRIFNPSYDISAWTMALLSFAAVLTAVLSITGSAVLALGKHCWYLLGWLVAVGVAVAFLLGPWGIESRALIALLVGPAAGIAIHFAAIQSEAQPRP